MKMRFALSIVGLVMAVGFVGGTAVYYHAHPEKVIKEQERPHFRPPGDRGRS